MNIKFNDSEFATLKHIIRDIEYLSGAIADMRAGLVGDKKNNEVFLHQLLAKYLTAGDGYAPKAEFTRLAMDAKLLRSMLELLAGHFEAHLLRWAARLKEQFGINLTEVAD